MKSVIPAEVMSLADKDSLDYLTMKGTRAPSVNNPSGQFQVGKLESNLRLDLNANNISLG